MPRERTMDLAVAPGTPALTWNQVHKMACALVHETPAEHTSTIPKPWSATIEHADAAPRLRLRLLDDSRPVRDPPTGLHLDGHHYTVVNVEDRDVAFGQLLTAPHAKSVRMDHLTPTCLSVASDRRPDGTHGPKRYLPIPEPVAVYRGLCRRWNTNAPAPLRLSDGVIAEVTARVALAEQDTRTVVADISDGTRPGFLGKVVYVLAGPDRDTHTRQAFTALSRFAALCGVGGQTSHGLGTVTVRTR